MKKTILLAASMALAAGFCACDDELDVKNPNAQTTESFGSTEAELQEAIIACYNRIRLEGTFARVGYAIDAVRGDEVWNAGQVWYLEYDNQNAPSNNEIGCSWIWRDWYNVVNRSNFVLSKVDGVKMSDDKYNEIAGQAYFMRGMAWYELATYFQTVPLMVNYSDYGTLQSMNKGNSTQDEVLDQAESDLKKALEMLPTRDKGGEWAAGRCTKGSAAGFLAKTYLFRQKYAEANAVLGDIIGGKYGKYRLMPDYGDNFREGSAENNDESIFEVQFMDYGKGGTEEEWTPVNINREATQQHAIESNYSPAEFGGWGDLAGASWVYELFKAERCTDGTLDPRLYWTLNTYEAEYDSYTGGRNAGYPNGNDPRCNVFYGQPLTYSPVTNGTNGGFSIAKYTYSRLNICEKAVTGLRCGVNLRIIRYSDILLLAAECENELNGPNATAIGYINQVRQRAGLAPLDQSKFTSKDLLFEQIANVERPKELGCEHGRGADLIRWGFYYDDSRLNQLKQHGAYKLGANTEELLKTPVTLDNNSDGSTYNFYNAGHEYLPIFQPYIDSNPNLTGNSANNSSDNAAAWKSKYKVHPVANL